mgnify:CR=1 FL=1
MMHTRIAQKQLLMHSRALLASAFFGLLIFPTVTLGFGEIQITEINYRGYTDWSDETESNASDEFITVENTTGAAINLEGFTLRVISGSSDKTIELGGEILDTLQIRKITRSQESNPMLPDTWHTADIPSLHNTKGAYLELRNTEGITVDSVNMYGQWPLAANQGEKLVKESVGTWAIAELAEGAKNEDITVPETPAEEEDYENMVIISEFLPNPVGSDAEGEFVELYNTSDQEVVLDGWELDDIESGGSRPMSLSGSIPARSWYVISKPELSISLNNSGEGVDAVRLIDPAGIVQDEVTYTLSEVQEGWSYSWFEGSFEWSSEITPGNANKSTPQLPIPDQESEDDLDQERDEVADIPSNTIKISEVYPYPTGGSEDEFIELYNTQTQAISLEGWAIGDLGKTVPLTGYIPARSYRVLSFLETRIYLNNSGETVMLYEPNQTLHDQVLIPKAERGLSFIPIGNTWDWTTSITRGYSNQLSRDSVGGGEQESEEEEYQLISSLDETSRLEDGLLVSVSGWVVSGLEEFFSRSLYLTDGVRTIRIRMPKDQNVDIPRNQKIQVFGEWHTSDTQAYLNLDSYQITESGTSPAIQVVSAIQPEFWGQQITLQGVLASQSGTSLAIATDAGEVSIKLAKSIEKPEITKGDQIQVTGIIELYRGEPRVLVLDQAGIRSLEQPDGEEPEEQNESSSGDEATIPDQTEYEYIAWDTFDQPGLLVEESQPLINRFRSLIQWMPWQLRESRSFLLALVANIIWWVLLGLRSWVRR